MEEDWIETPGGGDDTTMSGVSLFPTVCKPISNQVNFGNVKDTWLCYILRLNLVELLDFNFINLPQNVKVLKGFSRFGQEHNHQAGWLIFFFYLNTEYADLHSRAPKTVTLTF